MKVNWIGIAIAFIFLSNMNYAQKIEDEVRSYKISGKVIDKTTQNPVEYATAVLLEPGDSTQVSGIATGISGRFTLQPESPGTYILQISFVGYRDYYQKVSIGPNSRKLNLGKIPLKKKASDIEEVTVQASEYSMDYEIDKKVVHVDEQYSSISGDAADILKALPSVQVDIEGNVSLRGNTNFTVLIDDRPTVLEANEALQQIPATSIKDIEIITNPSAKYDPEGTAGIINIITKKDALMGISGIVHLNAGLDEKYGGDFQFNYKNDDIKAFIGADYNTRKYPGTMELENRTYRDDTTFFLTSEGSNTDEDRDYSFRAGLDWYLNEKSTLSISSRYGSGRNQEVSRTLYNEWNSFNTSKTTYTSRENGKREHEFVALNTEFTHEFDSTDHQLDVRLMMYQYDGDGYNRNALINASDDIQSSQKSMEGGPSKGLRYRMNYLKPFTEKLEMELGTQGRLTHSNEWNEMYQYSILTNKYVLQDEFSHESVYERSIHAAYGLVKGNLDKFQYQLGFRGEYTYRDITIKDRDGATKINRWDYFPTAHFSYTLPHKQQLMASYTRRIDRPHSWFMEPFYTWEDAYNIRKGNPDLKPEYIDSWELGYQNDFNNSSFSAELYYRKTTNQIEWVQSVYEDNIMLQTFENVGEDYNMGSEVMFNTNFASWWENSLTGNFYRYRVKGKINGQSFDKSSFSYTFNWNQTFHLNDQLQIQLNPEYEGPEVEAQEREKASFEVDGAVRYALFHDKLSMTLQVRDIFSTGKHEEIIDEENFYNYRLHENKTPIVMFNVTWHINDKGRQNNNERGEQGGGGQMGF
mgnify:CR=1 FL=1